MKKTMIFFLVSLMIVMLPFESRAEYSKPQEDSKQLQYQDMLMLFLLPQIQKSVDDYYSKLFTEKPLVYPYFIDVVKSERVNGFRGFDFLMTIEVTPVVGPHISVGKDRLTFEISPSIPNTAKLVKYKHLYTEELPSNWKHIIKKNND